MSIKTSPVPACPVCGGDGPVTIAGALDYITKLPGSWTYRECARCHSLWMDPCPVREDIGKLYPKNYHFTHAEPAAGIKPARGFAASAKLSILESYFGYAGLTDGADSRLGVWFGKFSGVIASIRRRAGRTARFLKAHKNGRLLDVGCGNGGFLNVMEELGWECEGIEPDPIAAEVAKRAGHKVQHGSVEDFPLPESHYDAVTLSHVMEHFPQPDVALARIVRLLKPGGVFVSVSPNPTGMIRRFYRKEWYSYDAPRHLVLPSLRGYELLCEGLGLRPICWTSPANCFFYLKETLSIRRTGATGNCHEKLWPALFSIATSLVLPLFPEAGEELVCYAIKQ